MNIFFVSDTHFQHKNILSHEPARPFKTIELHDQAIIQNWNSRVRPSDIVWHLGDVGLFHKFSTEPIRACNGKKRLILGNHDIFGIDHYLQYFESVHATVDKYGYLMSHIPIHPFSVNRWQCNIHGHTHSKIIDDPRYFNVSIERINYTPISLDEIRKELHENNKL